MGVSKLSCPNECARKDDACRVTGTVLPGAFSGWSAQPMERKEFWFQQLKRQAKCPDVDCLLKLPAEQLRVAYLAIPNGVCCAPSLLGDPWIPWAPAIDGVELTAHPLELLEQGKVNPVPMVIGSTLDDGARFFEVDYNLSAPGFLALFQEKFGSTRQQAELYSSESHVAVSGRADGWWSAQRAVTDQNFFCSSHVAVRRLATSAKVFAYLFASSLDSQVVAHNSDLAFVWMNLPNATEEQKQLAADVGMAWYRFAASEDPGSTWPQVSAASAPMLKFQVASQGGNQVLNGIPAMSKPSLDDSPTNGGQWKLQRSAVRFYVRLGPAEGQSETSDSPGSLRLKGRLPFSQPDLRSPRSRPEIDRRLDEGGHRTLKRENQSSGCVKPGQSGV
eukprot:Skav212537  [mRNA]  locus=scaffold1851:141565:142909:+ [translate_table: standard]